MDVVGGFALAASAGLAGGVFRDLLLGATPPVALTNPVYLCLVGVAVLFSASNRFQRVFNRPILAFDAMGLGLFSVTGAIKAQTAGISIKL